MEWDCGVRGGRARRQGMTASHITGPRPVRVRRDLPPRGSFCSSSRCNSVVRMAHPRVFEGG